MGSPPRSEMEDQDLLVFMKLVSAFGDWRKAIVAFLYRHPNSVENSCT